MNTPLEWQVTPFVEAERLGFPPPLGTYKNYEVRSPQILQFICCMLPLSVAQKQFDIPLRFVRHAAGFCGGAELEVLHGDQ